MKKINIKNRLIDLEKDCKSILINFFLKKKINEKKNCINFWYYWTRRILLS